MGITHWWRKVAPRTGAEISAKFCDDYEVLFDSSSAKFVPGVGPVIQSNGLDVLGENKTGNVTVNRQTFVEALLAENFDRNPSFLEFFESIHIAYAKALGSWTGGQDTVVFQLHRLRADVVDIRGARDFRVVRMIREPVESAVSLMRHRTTMGKTQRSPLSLVRQALLDYGPLYGASESCRALRLEDLNSRPRDTLSRLCAWLGLEWDDSLLRSTFNGMKWWGLPTSSDQQSGFRSSSRPPSVSESDKARIQTLLPGLYESWNYELMGRKAFSLAPFDFEVESGFVSSRRERAVEIAKLVASNFRTSSNRPEMVI